MIGMGHDALLVPTYTPILTDEASVSSQKLFFGGLNVYLQQLSPIFRYLPRWTDAPLSSPRLVRWIASKSMGTTADKLGPMTVSMLKGAEGNQRKEVSRLCDWLETEQPDVVVFSNLLIAGCVETIKQRLDCSVVVVLQGDDIFYESLLPEFREQAIVQLRRIAGHVDRFILNSNDYAQRMQELLQFPPQKAFVSPLSIDGSDFENLERGGSETEVLRIGYLARLAPEKGLHLLVEAFTKLAKREAFDHVHLDIAGWLGPQHQSYWEDAQESLRAAGLDDRFRYHGSVDRKGKLRFLESVDLLCVPTTYREPKGLFALEALSAGVPVLLPDHGAFPELLAAHGGGQLFAASDVEALVEGLEQLLSDRDGLKQLGSVGRRSVFETAQSKHEAERWLEMFAELVDQQSGCDDGKSRR